MLTIRYRSFSHKISSYYRFFSDLNRISQVYDNEKSIEYVFSKPELKNQTSTTTSTTRNLLQNNKVVDKLSILENTKSIVNGSVLHFMPKGYPHSVSSGYKTFMIGQMLSVTLSSAGGVLSMQALLSAIGIGSGSIPLAATLNWILKDGLGQLGGVIFASMVNNKFDADPKRWRMIASISMDVSSFIELLTPLAPSYFLLLASVANVGKNISFLAASASRAAVHKTFAIHENLADVTAKTGSQCILSSMIGTSLGISAAAYIGNDYASTVTVFLSCSFLSLISTYISLKNVVLKTLSINRLDAIMTAYDTEHQQILSPEALNQMEAFLGIDSDANLSELIIGCDVDEAVMYEDDLQALVKHYSDDNYIISIQCYPAIRKATVYLLVKENCTKEELLKGISIAFHHRLRLKQEGYQGTLTYQERMQYRMKHVQRFDMIEKEQTSGRDSNLFIKKLVKSGWLIDELMLETRFARLKL